MDRTTRLVLVLVVAWAAPLWGQTASEKKATVAYLRGLQARDGGFRPARPAADGRAVAPGLRATTAALRALRHFGGEAPDARAAARFVRSCFAPAGGGFADAPGGKPDVFATAVGLMGVVELKIPAEPYAGAVNYLAGHARLFEDVRIAAAGLEAVGRRPARAGAWLKQVTARANRDGTYGKGAGTARATGSAVVTVLRLGGQVEHRDRVLKALKEGQRQDGGFGKEDAAGSDLETCYRVMRAFVMLKDRPAHPEKLRAFVARCRNADGGYGVMPGRPSGVAGTYFAGTLLHWLDAR